MRGADYFTYALAPTLALACALVTTRVPALREHSTFLLPLAATAASAWLGGLGPALVSALIAVLLLGPAATREPIRLGVFAGIVAAFGLVGERARRRRAERETLRTVAEGAERRFAFLAEASATLTASLDYDVTLANVARLAVPFLADWCTVDLVDAGGGVRRVAIAYGNPTKSELARAAEIYPPDPEGRHPRTRVLRTGVAELFAEVRTEELALAASHAEHLRVMQAVGYRSAMIVPLVAHGQTLGAMTFATAESARRYAPTDLTFAGDLARRAALAIDNARLFRAVEEARTEAVAASRAKDDFLAIVSHELRTPLAAALIWTRLLSRADVAPARVAQAAEAIERSMKRQARLVEDLLDVSRVMSGGLRLDRRPVDLAQAVAAAVDGMRAAAAAKGVDVVLVAAPLPGSVLGDPRRLEQIVSNLLENAVEYTSEGGRVDVALEADSHGARIRVTDTGEGIAPELVPHVFEHFRQADSTSTRRHGGLGLGLTIVRELVRLHGGSVRAESRGHGSGATFVVELPLAVERAQAG